MLTPTEFPRAREATTLVTEGGVGDFNQIDLQKALAGKAASAFPSIGELTEQMFGSRIAEGSGDRVPAHVPLLHVRREPTAPRWSRSSSDSVRRSPIAASSPEQAFDDTLSVTLIEPSPAIRTGLRRDDRFARPRRIDRDSIATGSPTRATSRS